MTVEVRLFAVLTDHTGWSRQSMDAPAGRTVEQLWQQLVQAHPGLGSLGYRPMVACDCRYSDWDSVLDDVQEVAFLPPVSGG
ncbi:MAG: MoaD/ThiS family protein [Acidobacteriota bacterium]|nr:MoaD/ThiS family protein [Acidobacteriota bacterium]MDH3786798.1 MoaD/ThiS family protein [Acidobacteriota bacterium]